MIKTIIKHFVYGIVGACVLFVMTIVFWDLTGDSRLQEFFDNFTIYALGYVIIGLGFSMSSIVYEIKRLPFLLKVVINMLVGFCIFFLVGPNIGIFSLESPLIVLYVAIAIILFVAAWFSDYLFHKRDAKKMNSKVKERKAERSLSE